MNGGPLEDMEVSIQALEDEADDNFVPCFQGSLYTIITS
jgi:hypothetical protein